MRRAVGWLLRQLVAIRTRLLVINVVLVLVPIFGIEGARTFEREALRMLEAGMRQHAQILRTLLENNRDAAGRPRLRLLGPALERIARRTRHRIRILDREGRVVADSHLEGPPEGPEPTVSGWYGAGPPPRRMHPPGQPSTDPGPLSGRREIRAAAQGELGTATRVHERIGRVFLFVAMPVMAERRVEGMVYVTRSTVPVLMTLHRLRRNLFRILLVALGITAFLSLFLAATISRPLSRLTRRAARLAAGDRSSSMYLSRRDEIGQLARAFDALVRQLDSRASYISDFAANISHEFKTPLTSIRGAAELLADGADDDPDARQRFLHNIQKDVDRLDRLVSRILELSRIEATLERQPRTRHDLRESIHTLAEAFADSAVQVRVGDAHELSVVANRPHIESALRALVENAVRHSPEPGSVAIEGKRDPGGQVRIRVVDQGPGISAANQAKVFQRFFTTEAARGGTGLGLAIVEVVARAHGGQVALRSAPGQGCTFELVLPGP